ncbi:MAG: 30S ribosomal protein S20 [Parcubacteria group bacterium CG_4_9_14_0_2_um_filter_35_11]|nr:MAG: 30S ribosomal protein S20 [Parcubacteria group bacterium CG07_land_8_20_14_0_80_35_11]PJC47440.1 MAG: 30S ribosomal protein S20 [Parcubacteria group bacterium CG_4_9_14_0_2_um_filter_35_11]
MPITKSAKKALRQARKRERRNLLWKNKIKKIKKDIKRLIENKKIAEAKKILPQFYKAVDKAAKNNIIKKNTAARKKSRLTKLITMAK